MAAMAVVTTEAAGAAEMTEAGVAGVAEAREEGAVMVAADGEVELRQRTRASA